MEKAIKARPIYTLGEELFNSISHGIGTLLAIAGCVVAIVTAACSGSPVKVVGASIYGAGLIILFLMSTLYHALANDKAKKVFRVFDHTSIYILIACSYTPITLVTLNGALGWTIFGIVWAVSIVGIVLNSVSIEKFKKFSMISYLALGWCIVPAIMPLVRSLHTTGLVFLVLGGIMYTLGFIFYKMKSIRYMHSVWHMFVLVGAILQYFCILLYVVK